MFSIFHSLYFVDEPRIRIKTKRFHQNNHHVQKCGSAIERKRRGRDLS